MVSVSFVKEKNKNLIKIAQDFLYINLAKEAVVDYKITRYVGNKKISSNKRVAISFSFLGINEKSGGLKKKLNFTVNNFVNLKIR